MVGIDLEADGFFSPGDHGKAQARRQDACVKEAADQSLGRRAISDQQRDDGVGAGNGFFAQMGESFPELPGSFM